MSQSTGVYVRDKTYGWLPASVLSYEENKTAAVTVFVPTEGEGEDKKEERKIKLADYEGHALPLQNVDEGGNLIEMADMCDLPSLHEAAILYNLKARHQRCRPYTRVGDIVIACNPFQWIEGLYAPETREVYVDRLIWRANSAEAAATDVLAELEPHVYETSSMAFKGLAVDGNHQSILVSGESGAGKTETVKIVMNHLASIHSSAADSAASAESTSVVVRRVLDSNPLLEAFGNAKTVRNDNSSRFGKYIQLQFDVEDASVANYAGRAVPNCVLAGSTCETYLLEKSRVVSHEGDERTYHIFYQLLAAPDEKKAEIWQGLAGTNFDSFKYVGETTTKKIEGRTDGQSWERTVQALEIVQVTGDKLRTLMRAISVVMQLGNITFEADPDDEEKTVVSSEEELNRLADVMEAPVDDVRQALTYRTVTAARNESYTVPLKVQDSYDSTNAFAKEIYQNVFDWLVRTINNATSAENNYPDAADVEDYGLIGLLDIFGFESFKVNRFEQLCINYANEKLQQKYTMDIFRSVQEEYEYEGIELGEVTFADNADVLNLVEGRMGLISVLNEECVRPKGNDASFVSKVKMVNKDISCLVQDRLHRPTEFAIAHYAGPVKYDATNFVTKNTDMLPKDLLDCACKSGNQLIANELKAAADAKNNPPPGAAGGGGPGKKPGGGRRAGAMTVATKFRTQLTSLMNNIAKTRTRYIRCIKPNPEKEPLKMNLLSSMEQLRCAGVVAAVTISRVAFPNRLLHLTALERFRCLVKKSDHALLEEMDTALSSSDAARNAEEKKDDAQNDTSPFKNVINSLMTGLLADFASKNTDGSTRAAFAVGKTRVYFRTGALEFLEAERMLALGAKAIVLEQYVRRFVAKSVYTKKRSATIVAQAVARRLLARCLLIRSQKSVTTISCWIRCYFARMELVKRRRARAATKIQARSRTRQSVAKFQKIRWAATTIQRIARGAMQRPKYHAMLVEAREEAKVNSKLAALQKRLAEAEMKWMQADKKRIEAEKKAATVATAAVTPGGDAEGAAAVAAARSAAEAAVAGTAVDEDAPPRRPEDEEGKSQKALMDESTEMLEVLRKEVFKLRSKNYLLRTDLNDMKEAHQQLNEHHASVTASFEALKQHAAQLSTANMKLVVQATEQKKALNDTKKQLQDIEFVHTAEVTKLKSELQKKSIEHEAVRQELEMLKKSGKYEQNINPRRVMDPSRERHFDAFNPFQPHTRGYRTHRGSGYGHENGPPPPQQQQQMGMGMGMGAGPPPPQHRPPRWTGGVGGSAAFEPEDEFVNAEGGYAMRYGQAPRTVHGNRRHMHHRPGGPLPPPPATVGSANKSSLAAASGAPLSVQSSLSAKATAFRSKNPLPSPSGGGGGGAPTSSLAAASSLKKAASGAPSSLANAGRGGGGQRR